MVLGSRVVVWSISEMHIDAVRELQAAEEKTHDEMALGISESSSHRKTAESQRASPQNKKPPQQSYPAWRKKPGGMQRAAIKKNPDHRQRPRKSGLAPERKGQNDPDDRPNE